ncbi:MAG: hypothetical protein E6I52_28760 [Chloroflexi bacterium]|nr:MAG: hypothetical protein E6I52_28760 [Chloroflexota bacterium]
MPELGDSLGLAVALGLGLLLVAWYWAGNELMRRRAHRLALWSKRVIDPLGGKQSIRWLGGQAFRLEVEEPKAPFRTLMLTGLIESWDVPMVWAWNRLHGRRDMVLLQATLLSQPLFGLEVYRPGTVLAGDSRHFAHQEGWVEEALDDLTVAAPGEPPRRLAAELVKVLDAERPRLIRLAVRRQGSHLTLALSVPDPALFDPSDVNRLAQRMAERISQPAG